MKISNFLLFIAFSICESKSADKGGKEIKISKPDAKLAKVQLTATNANIVNVNTWMSTSSDLNPPEFSILGPTNSSTTGIKFNSY